MIGEHEYRLIAVMHDGTVVEKDYTWNPNRSKDPAHWFSSYQTVQMANLVVCVHLRTGKTEVVKNRWGDDGVVERKNHSRADESNEPRSWGPDRIR